MTTSDSRNQHDLVAEMRKAEQERQAGYRERALKLFPHVCARCARTFEGKRLRELTVHHKDHDHGNNPPDGSNWELLCIYCHDHEHTRGVQEERSKDGPTDRLERPMLLHTPFAALGDRFKQSK
jgi:5-methylcytosine-specific restriction endonuclease McrA